MSCEEVNRAEFQSFPLVPNIEASRWIETRIISRKRVPHGKTNEKIQGIIKNNNIRESGKGIPRSSTSVVNIRRHGVDINST